MNRLNDGKFVAAQITGGRDGQEDAFAIADLTDARGEKFLFVIADGMGGHTGAAQVARLAVQNFEDAARSGQGPLALRLRPALEAANGRIAIEASRTPAIKGAGCTLVAAAVEGTILSWISVGDSLLLLFRDRKLIKLNASHSSSVGTGSRSRTGGVRPKFLRAAVRGDEIALIDSSRAAKPFRLHPDDVIILASDGLECVADKRIASIVRRSRKLTPTAILQRLLMAVEDRPRRLQDNTTVVVYRVPHGNATRRGSNSTFRQFWIQLSLLALLGALLFAAGKWWFS